MNESSEQAKNINKIQPILLAGAEDAVRRRRFAN
jgi:hypothetical protein